MVILFSQIATHPHIRRGSIVQQFREWAWICGIQVSIQAGIFFFESPWYARRPNCRPKARQVGTAAVSFRTNDSERKFLWKILCSPNGLCPARREGTLKGEGKRNIGGFVTGKLLRLKVSPTVAPSFLQQPFYWRLLKVAVCVCLLASRRSNQNLRILPPFRPHRFAVWTHKPL